MATNSVTEINSFIGKFTSVWQQGHHASLYMGQFLRGEIFGPQMSEIWSSSRTAGDYKVDFINNNFFVILGM